MLPFGVTILATVSQSSEIPEGLTNYPVLFEQKMINVLNPQHFAEIPQQEIMQHVFKI
jgi:hypothetical protein